MLVAPPIGTTDTRKAVRSWPRRKASLSTASRSLSPSTNTVVACIEIVCRTPSHGGARVAERCLSAVAQTSSTHSDSFHPRILAGELALSGPPRSDKQPEDGCQREGGEDGRRPEPGPSAGQEVAANSERCVG